MTRGEILLHIVTHTGYHRGFVADPELSELDGEETHDEGCLSIPGPYAPTTRALRVRLRGRDLDGSPLDITAEGLLARIFQHETDHLDGILFFDRMRGFDSLTFLDEFARYWAKGGDDED